MTAQRGERRLAKAREGGLPSHAIAGGRGSLLIFSNEDVFIKLSITARRRIALLRACCSLRRYRDCHCAIGMLMEKQSCFLAPISQIILPFVSARL